MGREWESDLHSKGSTIEHLTGRFLTLTLGEYLSPGSLVSELCISAAGSLRAASAAPSLLSSSFTTTEGPSPPSLRTSLSLAWLAFSSSLALSGLRGNLMPSAAESTAEGGGQLDNRDWMVSGVVEILELSKCLLQYKQKMYSVYCKHL